MSTRAGGTMTAIDPSDDDAISLRDLRNGSLSSAASLTSDTVRAYLREIGRVSLLTGELEVVCAKRIEKGLAAAEELAEATEPSERRALERAIRDGQEAKDLLI